MTPDPAPLHSPSHRRLLARPSAEASPADVDAIIVPTIRPVPYLRHAIRVAEELGCMLIVLCSRRADARKIIDGCGPGSRLIAIEVPPTGGKGLPPLQTSELLATREFKIFARRSDVSLKRNLGLLLARMTGWSRVVFLDDDIEVTAPQELGLAARHLDTHDAVGLHVDGFPDNSVVCHANRDAGGEQDTFVGTGALAVDPLSTMSFFPDIYNEDWFYLLNDVCLRSVAVIGSVKQAAYDPFAYADRARAEEFGDVLAEGIFSLLDRGRRVRDADAAFWADFLHRRQLFIDDVRSRTLSRPDTEDRKRRLCALSAASGRLKLITPEQCTRYLKAWRIDRGRWRNHVSGLPHNVSIAEALDRLSLTWHARVPQETGISLGSAP